MQGLTFITFNVLKKCNIFCQAAQPKWPNTDSYIDSHFSYEATTEKDTHQTQQPSHP